MDTLLDGGIHPGELLLVFGERGAGKTSFLFQEALRFATERIGSTLVYTEGRVPLGRLAEMAGGEWERMGDLIWVMEVKRFEEQDELVDQLEDKIPQGTGLLLFDSITSCYRGSLGTGKANIPLNKLLSRQLALIKDLCRRKELAAILTSEVTARIFGGGVQPVAAAILTYWSDRVLRFEKVHGELRKVTVTKPESTKNALIRLTVKGLDG
jgi:KaiC/GvpD/RAD55 family RecA-like ATPase